MVFQIALRVILGVAMAGIGYYLANQALPETPILGSIAFLPALIAFISGAIGVFLVPALSAVAQRWLVSFVSLLAKELRSQLPFSRLNRTPKSESRPGRNAMILDTSAIIDGRIGEIAKTGFLDGTLIIPQFILGELQHIADSSDPIRRSRGRRGFEVIEELKKLTSLKVEISSLDFPNIKPADDKLVQMGRKLRAKVITTDYNLNKVAKISGVMILNVNELANSIKTVVLPGEAMSIKIIQAGKEREQGVGYLADGTMVVVQGGSKMIGQTVETEVERVFQTVAGRMVFVKPINS